ncbi:hypothetical protein IQ06DRAFT_307453 [Phaeosphaeriaceae sp. SRC1lsM3a]|nr:hypothetical protein IQ06DRAFT_307453 [Stagonospora sp. SRC1lsM3a]
MKLLSSTLAVASALGATSEAAVPSGCTATYQPQSGENCYTVVNRFQNFTGTDLYHWNPEIGVNCFGLSDSRPVCINLPPNKPGTPFKAGDIFAASLPPVPQQPDIVAGCKYFEYSDSNGPGLAQILRTNNSKSISI